MSCILTIIKDEEEAEYFNALFSKANIKVVRAFPSFQNYLQMLQYNPIMVLMELPISPGFQLKFLSVLKKNKDVRDIPFILYGPKFKADTKQMIDRSGAALYLPRPLDPKRMILEIQRVLKIASIRRSKSGNITQNKPIPKKDVNQLTKEDKERILDKSIPVMERLGIMVSHVGQLMAFPATVASILKVTQSDKTGASDLAKIIKSDPAISAEVLKVSNSIYYASRSKRIMDVKDAIIRIGFTQTKNIAMSLSVLKVMTNKNYETGFDHIEFWFHCLGTSIVCERIAKKTRMISQEEAFIAGLLHDMGILLFNEFFNDIFLSILEKSTEEGLRFYDCEHDILGFSHIDLTIILLEQWQFPEELLIGIKNLYLPNSLSEDMLKETPIPALVEIAEDICKSLQIGREADCCVRPVPSELIKKFGLVYGLQGAFVEDIYKEINMFNSFLNIDKRSYPVATGGIENAEKVKIAGLSFSDEVYNPVFEYIRSQKYGLTIFTTIEEAMDAVGESHALIVTDCADDNLEQIKSISNQRMMRFEPEKTEEEAANFIPTDANAIVFDLSQKLNCNDFKQNIIISGYPVDLRNVDMALAGLLLENIVTDNLNKMGTLKPVSKVNLKGDILDTVHVLLVNKDAENRSVFKGYVERTLKSTVIDEVNDFEKAINIAKATSNELHLVIIEVSSGHLPLSQVVATILALPNHKRVQFIVTFTDIREEDRQVLCKIEEVQFMRFNDSIDEFIKIVEKIPLLVPQITMA